jgi:hypothetical protein
MTHERVAEAVSESTADLVLRQLRGLSVYPAGFSDRRVRVERRRLTFWSVLYGGFRPRRRDARRIAETAVPVVDWHAAHLLGVAVAIMLLCLVDAVLTVMFVLAGGMELNPIMKGLLAIDVRLFAIGKILLTGLGVAVLVLLSKMRFFGHMRVDASLYGLLAVYVGLVAYEFVIFSSFFA